MRRLPIYFLIDISESMVGEQIQFVEEGIGTIIKGLKSDPYALETAWISIIVFAGQAKTIMPLQELVSFYPPKFPIGSGTSLGKGLGHLMYELRTNIKKTTTEVKGDWKPLIFLFTDGVATDHPNQAIDEWKRNWAKSANLVAISFGDEDSIGNLSKLTNDVLLFKNTTSESYKAFFKWVTDSIRTSSESVDRNGTGFEMAEVDGETISKIDLSKTPREKYFVDSKYVILLSKCENTKRPYLIKYKKDLSDSEIQGFKTISYRLNGAFPIDKTYFEFAEDNAMQQKINSNELQGTPSCPCCGNQIGFAMCSCGSIHCLSGPGESTCPWCSLVNDYQFGDGSFDVGRSQG